MTEVLELAGYVGPHRESHEPKLNGLSLLAAGVTPVSGFIAFDLTHGQTQFGMACNGDLGCCGFSADQHLNALKALAAGDANWMQISLLTFCPQFASLEPAYFAYGIAQGEPGPRPDEGVDNATMLAWLYKLGIIKGYFEVPLEYADWFAATFNGAIVGQVLDGPTAIAAFNARPRGVWDTMGKSDGHDTVLAKGDGLGGGQELTWGGLITFTPGYRATNWTDVWVVVTKDDTNVNQVALDAILTEMHGVVTEESIAAHKESFMHKLEQDAVHFGHKVEDLLGNAETKTEADVKEVVVDVEADAKKDWETLEKKLTALVDWMKRKDNIRTMGTDAKYAEDVAQLVGELLILANRFKVL